ncbi:MAG: hypothetical protein WC796_05840 [Candidatus Pacearchaeota archaeon]|jgi:hypothetical protein
METIGNFRELSELARGLPTESPKLSLDHLFLEGYLNPTADYSQQELPQAFFQASREVERIARESFPLKVFGIEASAPPIHEKHEGNVERYRGLVKIIGANGTESHLVFQASHILGDHHHYEPAPMNFKAYLSIDEYLEGTKQFLTTLWPLVRAVELSIPSALRIRAPVGNTDYQPGSILLVRACDVVATGHPALKKIGLDLPEKKLLLAGLEFD